MTTEKIAGISPPMYKRNCRRGGHPLPAAQDRGDPLSPRSTAPGVASSLVPRAAVADKPPAPTLPFPAPGDEVSYRCAALGQFYPAAVLVVRADGTLDVEILVSPPLTLTKKAWWPNDPLACPRQACTAPGLRGSIEDDEG